MRVRVTAAVSLATLLVFLCLSCSVFRTGPAATVKKFYKAVEGGQITEAIGFLSGQVRSNFGDQKLRAGLTQQAESIRQQHKGIKSMDTEKEDVLGETASVVTLITYLDGATQRDTSKLSLENNVWKISPEK